MIPVLLTGYRPAPQFGSTWRPIRKWAPSLGCQHPQNRNSSASVFLYIAVAQLTVRSYQGTPLFRLVLQSTLWSPHQGAARKLSLSHRRGTCHTYIRLMVQVHRQSASYGVKLMMMPYERWRLTRFIVLHP